MFPYLSVKFGRTISCGTMEIDVFVTTILFVEGSVYRSVSEYYDTLSSCTDQCSN